MEYLFCCSSGFNFFCFSYLNANFNYQDVDKAKEIFFNILDDEISNKMPNKYY